MFVHIKKNWKITHFDLTGSTDRKCKTWIWCQWIQSLLVISVQNFVFSCFLFDVEKHQFVSLVNLHLLHASWLSVELVASIFTRKAMYATWNVFEVFRAWGVHETLCFTQKGVGFLKVTYILSSLPSLKLILHITIYFTKTTV